MAASTTTLSRKRTQPKTTLRQDQVHVQEHDDAAAAAAAAAPAAVVVAEVVMMWWWQCR